MPREETKFSSITLRSKGYVTYGDDNKGKILDIGKVDTPPFITIDDVLYVEGLKRNLISTSQLCDKGFKINFTKDECIIEDEVSHELELIGKTINNIFIISLYDLSLEIKCLVVNNNGAWIWHKRIGCMMHVKKDRLCGA